ncbi:MAG TPA: Gfo/Idh/MocA family oxidoreductase [Caulobacterales bacterium]|nr:Gfo/Idh/MocA family oxidoreductase [Caulobacterales bacterium]
MSDIARRGVLQGAAALTALGGGAFAAETRRPYRVGLIGAGWFGKLDLFALMQVAPVEVVALCDVDSAMLAQARDKVMQRTDSLTRPRRRPAIYRDFREMLGAHPLDIVIVATPDHWHALPTIAALNAGAHVYMEKPITVDVREGEAVLAAARAKNRVVQVATQRRTSPFTKEAQRRVLEAGLLGKVGHVEVYCYYHQRPPRFPPPSAPPANLDWDFYCGPAPRVDYIPGMHPRDWRAFEVFGNGYMGDVGIHMIDLSRYLLNLGWPKSVASTGGILVDTQSAATVPDTQNATFMFDDVMMTWTNRQWGDPPDAGEQWGTTLHGEHGALLMYNAGYEFRPHEGARFGARLASELDEYPLDAQMQDWEQPLAAITRHHLRDFLAAIESGGRPTADIEEGHKSTACCILANTALKLGRTLHWDGHAVIGDDEADRVLARPYRAPWAHPAA